MQSKSWHFFSLSVCSNKWKYWVFVPQASGISFSLQKHYNNKVFFFHLEQKSQLFCRTQRHVFLCWSVVPVGDQIHSSCFEQTLWSNCSSFIHKHNQMSNAQCSLLSLYCQYLSVSLSLCSKSVRTHLIAECCSLLFASCLMLHEMCEWTSVTLCVLDFL